MKFRKPSFILMIIAAACFFSIEVKAQGEVTNVSFIPSAPTQLDNIKIVGSIMMYTAACDLINISCSLTGPNTIEVNAYHCYGMLTIICNENDTCELSPLPPGIYSVNFHLWAGTPCPSPGSFTNADVFQQTLTVTPVTGGTEKIEPTAPTLFPNPCHGNITLNCAGDAGILQILSPDGRLLKSLTLRKGTNDLFLGLPAGLYLAVIKTGDVYRNLQTLSIIR